MLAGREVPPQKKKVMATAKGSPVCRAALQLKATTGRGNDPDQDVALWSYSEKQNVHFTVAVPVVPCK